MDGMYSIRYLSRFSHALFARVAYIEDMPYRAATIANRILDLAKAAGRAITPLQLMKLVYISHGWSLGLRDKPLLEETVEAWKYGPVVPDLYQAVKRYGSNPVTERVPASFWSNEELSVDDRAFVDSVFQQYGHLNGIQLSHLTHMVGTPWQQVYQSNVYNIDIPNDLIAAHYRI